MKSSLLFPVIIGILSIMAGACLAEDFQSGFGGINWSTSLEQVENCQKIDDQGDIQYFIRTNQLHTLFGEPVPHVIYGFYQNAFFAVFVRIENDEAYFQTKTRLMDQLGMPQISFDKEGTVSTLRWTDGQVQIELFNDRSEQGFKLAYHYLPIVKKVFVKHKALSPPKRRGINLFPTKKGDTPEAVRILEF